MITKLYNIICAGCVAVAFSSCMDTIILPDDKTVDEDFWKSKSDVALMVNGAYAAMSTEDVISRLIVWGDFRSDEYVQSDESTANSDATATALSEIALANIQVTNKFATWSAFYTVINRCNIVLEKAAEMYTNGVDPNYTEGDYLADRSQMLALRSLCYFYLVRAFRDVPYIDVAYMNSSQDRDFVQLSPAEVLQRCIESLQEAAPNALSSRSYQVGMWRRVGWMTQDAIYSLLADIYLWRASVMHNPADYQQCVNYCNLVIQSKKEQHVLKRTEAVAPDYPLAEWKEMYGDLFVTQNAEESIYEIQNTNNTAVLTYLYKYTGKDAAQAGYMAATGIFNAVAANPNTKGMQVFPTNDIRYAASLFSNTGVETFAVRKMISQNVLTQNKQESRATAGRSASGFNQNWIVYRLTDVILMKAEALVQQVDTATFGLPEDEKKVKDSIATARLKEAFDLVAVVSKRATTDDQVLDWSKLKSTNHDGRDGMELLVMEERLRELCFEGKRWFDLLRYNYRHIEGVNYNAILGNIGEAALPANYEPMLSLMVRGRGTSGDGVKAKMTNEAYLYMPIPNADVILAPGLKQNPVYSSSSEYERN
ncbi:MAG: RagB/SusD family nutrient uptake outer membrane protein [Prevotella sp.]|nr:RagB/SusD family nutrient uptake outer membrane protein [Prevotella sp.]